MAGTGAPEIRRTLSLQAVQAVLVPACRPRVAGPRDRIAGTGHRNAVDDLGPQRWIGLRCRKQSGLKGKFTGASIRIPGSLADARAPE